MLCSCTDVVHGAHKASSHPSAGKLAPPPPFRPPPGHGVRGGPSLGSWAERPIDAQLGSMSLPAAPRLTNDAGAQSDPNPDPNVANGLRWREMVNPDVAKWRGTPAEVAERLVSEFTEQDLVSIVKHVMESCPGVSHDVLHPPRKRAQRNGVDVDALDQETFSRQTSPEEFPTAPPIIQFSASMYFATEEEPDVSVEILRLGDSDKACSVSYETVGMSALPNIKYVPMSGRLEFKAGDISKALKVHVINDDRWDTTLEFGLQLKDPSAGIDISDSLQSCRVKILDDDTFPSNKYRTLCKLGRFKDIPRISQLIEYCKMNLTHKAIRSGTRSIVAFDLLKNLYVIWSLCVRLFIVDFILVDIGNDRLLSEKTIHLVIAAALIMVPQFLVALMERAKVELKVGGMCRVILQTNIVRKFLSYDDSVRNTIMESDLIICINQDCPVVVQKGYFSFINLCKELGLLLLLLVYQVSVALGKGTGSPMSMVFVVLPTIFFPICVIAFFKKREEKTTMTLLRQDLARNELARDVEMVVRNVRLILDFSQRSSVIKKCIEGINKVNDTSIRSDIVDTDNKLFTPLLIAVFIAVYVVIGGRFTLTEQISIGQYLTNLEVYAQMCACWKKVYAELLTLNAALPAVEEVSRYLNLPIDLGQRRVMGNCARIINDQEREKAREVMKLRRHKGDHSIRYASDTVPLVLDNIGFVYHTLNHDQTVQGSLECETVKSPSHLKGESQSKAAKFDEEKGTQDVDMVKPCSIDIMEAKICWNLSVDQGSITALIGKHGDGKGTLLKIIGGVLLPTSGSLFVPPQLRICFVTQQPMFFVATLLDNLAFGLTATQRADSQQVQHIKDICRLIGISEPILDHLEDPMERVWPQSLSSAQLKKIHIARAFIANPELVCFERPTAGLDGKTLSIVMSMFQTFTRCRGLIDDGKDCNDHLKRPRTVIYTTERIEACYVADAIYMVKPHKLRQVEFAHLGEEMVHHAWGSTPHPADRVPR